MAIDFKKTTYSGSTPVIWRGECKMLPGGFKLLQSFVAGTVIFRGALAYANFDDMTAAIIKIAKVLTGGTTTKPRVMKGHYFQIGDTLMKLGVDDKSPIVKSIDTSNSDYDVIELSAAITGLAEGDTLQESTEHTPASGSGDTAVDAIPANPKYVGNMVVGADKELGKGFAVVDLAYEAVLLKKVAYPFPESWLVENSPCLKTNPNILFINQ